MFFFVAATRAVIFETTYILGDIWFAILAFENGSCNNKFGVIILEKKVSSHMGG
jgi:hypothetical protein